MYICRIFVQKAQKRIKIEQHRWVRWCGVQKNEDGSSDDLGEDEQMDRMDQMNLGNEKKHNYFRCSEHFIIIDWPAPCKAVTTDFL